MSSSTTTLTVRYVGENAAVFITLPFGASIAGDHIVEYTVSGPRPIVRFPGVHEVGNFETWKATKEAEGFRFSNPRVVTPQH
jgi:hypothetical protein